MVWVSEVVMTMMIDLAAFLRNTARGCPMVVVPLPRRPGIAVRMPGFDRA